MYTLIIDSATKVLYEALVQDGKVLDERYLKSQNDHAKNIVYVLEDMLKKASISVDDLGKIVCGIGPGSYTGVRMAVTVSKMIGAFKHVPIYEISTLNLMASGTKGKVLSMIDARRGNIFCATYNNGVLIDSEAIRNQEEYQSINKDATIVNQNDFKVDPLLVIDLAKLHENPHSLVPNYLQETEAERNLNNENK